MEQAILSGIKRNIANDKKVSSQEHVIILIVPAAKKRASKYVKQNTTEMKTEIENPTLFVDFNVFLLVIGRSRYKFSKKHKA